LIDKLTSSVDSFWEEVAPGKSRTGTSASKIGFEIKISKKLKNVVPCNDSRTNVIETTVYK
jgi:hypothetical protein